MLDASELPDPLQLSKALNYASDGPDGVVLTTYSSYDPARISHQLFAALREFDGKRSNAEALGAIVDEHGVRLSQGLLLVLYRQRILVTEQQGAPQVID